MPRQLGHRPEWRYAKWRTRRLQVERRGRARGGELAARAHRLFLERERKGEKVAQIAAVIGNGSLALRTSRLRHQLGDPDFSHERGTLLRPRPAPGATKLHHIGRA